MADENYDVDAAVTHLNAHAHADSLGRCASYVRQALAAGGIVISQGPAVELAKNYGPVLRTRGFVEVERSRLSPEQARVQGVPVAGRTVMRLRACVLAVITWAVLGMQPALAQSAASAERFLQTVYSAYAFNGDPPGIEAAGSHAIASPSLVQLIRKDQRALKGEAGYLDMDPICRCQDFDVKTTGIEVTVAKRQKAKAVVSFTNFRKPNKVEFDLVWVRGKWLIDDIRGSDDRRSLRDALQAEIADLVR